MASKSDPHLYQIDLIRIVSAFAIISIHVSNFVVNFYPHVASFDWGVALFLSSFFRWGTPLFVMISGFLLLNSSVSANPKLFYQRRLSKLLIPFIFWNIFYFFLNHNFSLSLMTLNDFFEDLWDAGTFYHLYFLFLIFGLYFISPFLKRLIDRGLNLNFWVPILILLSFLYTAYAVWFNGRQLNTAFTWFILYIGYYLAGFWLARSRFKIKPLWFYLSLLLPILGILADVYFIKIFGISDKGSFFTHRLSLLIAVPAITIFLFLVTRKFHFSSRVSSFLRATADLGLGVYLIHPTFIQIFAVLPPLLSLMHLHPVIWMFSAILSVALLSYVSVYFLKRTPLINRLV